MKCSYCGGNVREGSGIILVKNDGKVFNFCSSKCEKSFIMNRDPRNKKWTRTSRKERGKE